MTTPPTDIQPSAFSSGSPDPAALRRSPSRDGGPSRSSVWIAVAIACTITATTTLFFSRIPLSAARSAETKIAFQLGMALGSCAMLVLIAGLLSAIIAAGAMLFRSAFRNTFYGLFRVAVIVAAVVAAFPPIMRYSSIVEERQLADGIGGDLRQLSDAVGKSENIHQKIDLRFEAETDAGSLAGRIQGLSRKYFNEILDARNAQIDKVQSLKLETVLDPVTLSGDGGFEDAFGRLDQAEELSRQYEDQWHQINRDFVKTLEKADLDWDEKADFMKGLQLGLNQSEAQFQRTIQLERKIFVHARETLKFLDSHRAAWDVDGGQFAFSDNAVLEDYNSKIFQLQSLGTELETQQRAAIQQSSDASAL